MGLKDRVKKLEHKVNPPAPAQVIVVWSEDDPRIAEARRRGDKIITVEWPSDD